MTDTTYEVRIWKTEVYESKKGSRYNTYYVRWRVGKKSFREPFATSALAESFRSELMSAARRGEAFVLSTGRPVSWARQEAAEDWYQFACRYADMKWKRAAATSRRSTAEALVGVTCAMLSSRRGGPEASVLRSGLFGWAFNTQRRDDRSRPEEVSAALKWAERNTRPVAELAKPDVLRDVLNAIATKLDGKSAAPTVINRKRAVLYNALEYAVECGLLDVNPLPSLKWKAPKVTHEVDKRSVVNPVQARTLLNAVRDTKRSGPRLMACFACSYYSALRPEEAINLRAHNVVLPPLVWNDKTARWEEPPDGWGEFHLERSAPSAGKRWTDSGRDRDDRGLKHRAADAVRTVPVPPELVVILRAHIDTYGTGPDGRLFAGLPQKKRDGQRAAEVPVITYNRVWRRARAATFTKDVLSLPLAETPYSLRHACVSTWLNGGVPAPQVAEWAGHSVDVLLKVYAKCIHGQEVAARQRIVEALQSG
jgi:integrase